ncbi:MAG TPA: DUF72 domain-containing protein [Desulfurococcales archaeon]|nr:DUF72 domain-containing protein [Desulfurococcales archaeon]
MEYYKTFSVVEVQQTFYRIPSPSTLKRWREEAPKDFEFTIKAWQVITHPPTSPTWRKSGLKISKNNYDRYGYLRPTRENFEAWRKIIDVSRILRARIIVVQTPPSFGYSEENVRNIREFFSQVDRGNIIVGWEPRGTWKDHLDIVEKLVKELKLIHIVDIFKIRPVVTSDIVYIRLHGLNGEVNYRYKYRDEDLLKLLNYVSELQGMGVREVYVMFNNVFMFDDALRFKKLCSSRGFNVK